MKISLIHGADQNNSCIDGGFGFVKYNARFASGEKNGKFILPFDDDMGHGQSGTEHGTDLRFPFLELPVEICGTDILGFTQSSGGNIEKCILAHGLFQIKDWAFFHQAVEPVFRICIIPCDNGIGFCLDRIFHQLFGCGFLNHIQQGMPGVDVEAESRLL